MSDTLYLATEKNVKVGSEAVALGDIAKLSCSNPRVLAKAQTLKVMQIPKGQMLLSKQIRVLQKQMERSRLNLKNSLRKQKR